MEPRKPEIQENMDLLEPHVKVKAAQFPVNGQGTFIYTGKDEMQFSILVTPQHQKDEIPKNFIALRVSCKSTYFVESVDGVETILKSKQGDEDAGVGKGVVS